MVPGRILAATLSLPGDRELGLVCAYLRDGEGLSADNCTLLQTMADSAGVFRRVGLEVVVGADWNLTPDEVAQADWCEGAEMQLLCASGDLGTCRRAKGAARTLGYFACSAAVTGLIEDVMVMTEADSYPHWPVRMRFLPGAHRHDAATFSRPEAFPTEAVFGIALLRPPTMCQPERPGGTGVKRRRVRGRSVSAGVPPSQPMRSGRLLPSRSSRALQASVYASAGGAVGSRS